MREFWGVMEMFCLHLAMDTCLYLSSLMDRTRERHSKLCPRDSQFVTFITFRAQFPYDEQLTSILPPIRWEG